jgi:hypothetical protein
MKNLNWLNADTVSQLKEYARLQSMTHHFEGMQERENMFIEGFLAGVNFLKDSIEATAKEKERAAATDVL